MLCQRLESSDNSSPSLSCSGRYILLPLNDLICLKQSVEFLKLQYHIFPEYSNFINKFDNFMKNSVRCTDSISYSDGDNTSSASISVSNNIDTGTSSGNVGMKNIAGITKNSISVSKNVSSGLFNWSSLPLTYNCNICGEVIDDSWSSLSSSLSSSSISSSISSSYELSLQNAEIQLLSSYCSSCGINNDRCCITLNIITFDDLINCQVLKCPICKSFGRLPKSLSKPRRDVEVVNIPKDNTNNNISSDNNIIIDIENSEKIDKVLFSSDAEIESSRNDLNNCESNLNGDIIDKLHQHTAVNGLNYRWTFWSNNGPLCPFCVVSMLPIA